LPFIVLEIKGVINRVWVVFRVSLIVEEPWAALLSKLKGSSEGAGRG
jgi:hypothetical protein